MWAALGKFLGALFKALLPELAEQWRQPEEVLTVGDEATKSSVANSIRTQVRDSLRAEGAQLARVRNVSELEDDEGSILDLVVEGAVGEYKSNRLIFVKEKVPQLPQGAEVWLLDSHVVYRHPVMNTEVAVHRLDVLP